MNCKKRISEQGCVVVLREDLDKGKCVFCGQIKSRKYWERNAAKISEPKNYHSWDKIHASSVFDLSQQMTKTTLCRKTLEILGGKAKPKHFIWFFENVLEWKDGYPFNARALSTCLSGWSDIDKQGDYWVFV